MVDGSPVITKDPSNRRRFYFEERMALIGAMPLDHPPGGQQVRLPVPSMVAVLLEQEDRWPQALNWNNPSEKPESDLQFFGAIAAAGKISTPVLTVGERVLVGAEVSQMQGELVDHVARKIRLAQGPTAIQDPRRHGIY